MKFLAKFVFAAAVGGMGVATMYAAPSVLGGSSSYESEAVTIKTQMLADHQHVLRLKAAAIKEKDVIKLNCLNDKLVAMLPEMNIIDSLIDRLRSSADADKDNVLKDLQSSGSKVREQRELASQCAESKLIVTESSNRFTGPDVETPTDPFNPLDPGHYIEPPGFASPDR
jgi:hypothetical protein